MSSVAKLYSPEVLALAVDLTRWPAQASFPLHGEARSPTCGSVIFMDLTLDGGGAIDGLGLKVRACAIGQAAAALFARDAKGKTPEDIETTLHALERWVSNSGPMPQWPGLELIAAAREFPARHAAMLLPWRAALAGLKVPAETRS